MLSDLPRSLRHEYELYVEREIEGYKNSLPRSVLLSIGDEAVAALRAQEQLALDEMVLWDEVDRIIKARLRLPTYKAWRQRRLRILKKYRNPGHWGMEPTAAIVREINPTAEKHVLVTGERAQGAALYLAANGCSVTTIDAEDVVDRVMDAAAAAGLIGRVHGHVGGLDGWSPPIPLHAVICTPSAFDGLDPRERARVIGGLQSATTEGGVHLVQTIVAGQEVVTLEELTTRYTGWEISVERDTEVSRTFLARKARM